MGGVTPAGASNLISGQVMGTAPIDTISIIKNNREIWSRDYRKSKVLDAQSTEVELAFHSESHSKGHEIDNPRGWRLWYGYAIVRGAELVEINPGYQNALLPPPKQTARITKKYTLHYEHGEKPGAWVWC
jgi:hypothetical protein